MTANTDLWIFVLQWRKIDKILLRAPGEAVKQMAQACR
jgi:hypothetical protein